MSEASHGPGTPSNRQSFDLIIVGGGTAGCAAALEARRLGATVALLEPKLDRLGGDGLAGRSALLRQLEDLAGPLNRLGRGGKWGLGIRGSLEFDESKFWPEWANVTKQRVAAADQALRDSGVSVFPFRGFLTGERTVLLLDPESGDERQELEAKVVVLCVGRPRPEVENGKDSTAQAVLAAMERERRFPAEGTAIEPRLEGLALLGSFAPMGLLGMRAVSVPPKEDPLSDRFSEVVMDFLEPIPTAELSRSGMLVRALRDGFAAMPSRERPTNTNLISNLLGGRKLGLRPMKDGRILGVVGAYRVGPGDTGILAAGSCVCMDPEIPALLTRSGSRQEGVSAVRTVLMKTEPAPGRTPWWFSSTAAWQPIGVCGRWNRLGDGETAVRVRRHLDDGTRLLTLEEKLSGELVAALCLGDHAGEAILSCLDRLAHSRQREFGWRNPVLAAFI